MKRALRWLLVLVLAVSASAGAETQLRPWSGKSTPVLAGADLAGRPVDLKDFRGRVVLVNFWATWCEPCRDEMPSFERLRAKFAGRPFEVLTVNYGEGVAKIEAFLRKEGISLPVLLDPEKKIAADWKAGGLPMTFLVDAKGRIRYSAFGESDWSEGKSLEAVERLVAEVKIAR